MVQTLLAGRFKLAVRRETRQADVYNLVVGKNGSKLKDANGGRRNYLNWTGPGQVTFTEMTSLVALSAILGSILDAPVLDETGLKGTYNYSLEFSDPRLPADSRSRPDLFTAVQEQLGLQLQPVKRPIEIIVIDHVERPRRTGWFAITATALAGLLLPLTIIVLAWRRIGHWRLK